MRGACPGASSRRVGGPTRSGLIAIGPRSSSSKFYWNLNWEWWVGKIKAERRKARCRQGRQTERVTCQFSAESPDKDHDSLRPRLADIVYATSTSWFRTSSTLRHIQYCPRAWIFPFQTLAFHPPDHREIWPRCNKWQVLTAEVSSVLLLCLMVCE